MKIREQIFLKNGNNTEDMDYRDINPNDYNKIDFDDYDWDWYAEWRGWLSSDFEFDTDEINNTWVIITYTKIDDKNFDEEVEELEEVEICESELFEEYFGKTVEEYLDDKENDEN